MTIYRRIAGVRRPRQGGVTTLVSDTFTRVGDTFTLGIADTGQTWIGFGGSSRWQIVAGQAAPLGSGDFISGQAINAGTANATVQVTEVVASSTGPGIVFRYVDSLNYNIWYYVSGTSMRLSKYVAGVETVINTDAQTAAASGDVWAVSVDAANLITCKRNGATVRTATNAANATGTFYGLAGAYNSSDRYDTFTVTSP